MNLFRDAEKVNFDNYERGRQDVYLYHEEHLPYKTTIRKMRPPVYKIIFLLLYYFREKKYVGIFFFNKIFLKRGIVPYYNMTESVLSRKTANFLLYSQVLYTNYKNYLQMILDRDLKILV